MALPFALLIPGQPLLTKFDCTNGIYHVDFPDPKTIANFSIFLKKFDEKYQKDPNFILKTTVE